MAKVRQRGSTKWAGPFLILWGLFFGGFGVFIFGDELRYRNEGVEGQALVESKQYVPPSGEDSAQYRITYAFVAEDGASYGGSRSLSRSEWERAQAGDPVTVEYLRSDPGHNRSATNASTGFIIGPIVLGVGLLGGGAGVVLTVRTLRRRGASAEESAAERVADPATDPSMLPGDRVAGDPDPVTYAFRRPVSRIVIDLVVTPIAAAGFLTMAYLLVTGRLTDELGARAAGLVAGLFGVMLALGAISAFARGLRRTVVEVGPGGFWNPELGRLPWSEIAEVRFELLRMPAGSEHHTGTINYGRIGIVPTDPGRPRGSAVWRLAGALSHGMVALGNRLNPRSALTLDSATFGTYAYEVEGGLGPIIRRIRAFAPVVDRSPRAELRSALAADQATAASTAAPAAPAAGSPPLSAADVRELDALLMPGATPPSTAHGGSLMASLPVAATPALVAAESPRVAVRRTYGPPSGLLSSRPLGRFSDLIGAGQSLFFIGIAALAVVSFLPTISRVSPLFAVLVVVLFAPFVVPVVLALVDLPRRIGRAFSEDQDTLAVGPEGIWLPDMERVAWANVAEIKLDSISTTSDDDDGDATDRWRISVLPKDRRLLVERPWAVRQNDRFRAVVGRVVPFLGSWTRPSGFTVTSDQLDAPIEEVVDLISIYHPIVGDLEA
jgi:uncharacterized protein DUF3592